VLVPERAGRQLVGEARLLELGPPDAGHRLIEQQRL
jgi:hypothetical protein